MTPDTEKLNALLAAQQPCISIVTIEEHYALSVVREVAIERGQNLRIWSITSGLHDGLIEDGPVVPDTTHPAAALVSLASQSRTSQGIVAMLDLGPNLNDARTMRAFRDAVASMARARESIILIDYATALPPAARAIAAKMELSLPDAEEIEALVKSTLREYNARRQVTVDLTRGSLQTIVRNLRGLSRRQARQVIINCVCDDCRFDESDVNRILACKRQELASDTLLDYVEAPVNLDDIGGLVNLKAWLGRRRESLSDKAIAFGIEPPRGLLMLGVQGAGKSLAAKAVATAWHRPLLRMDVGALYDRYIGESERRLREALQQAESMSPIVLWIDEIEKGFASAASQSSDGGLSKRMFGSLLTWMQERTAPVFLIATANDIEALPPELLRKGRFDEIFFVDLPTLEARRAIFEIHLRKRKRNPFEFGLDELAEKSTGFSGAEIEQAIVSSMHDAFAAGEYLTTAHVSKLLEQSPPLSVTMAEKLEALREWSRGRCVPAD